MIYAYYITNIGQDINETLVIEGNDKDEDKIAERYNSWSIGKRLRVVPVVKTGDCWKVVVNQGHDIVFYEDVYSAVLRSCDEYGFICKRQEIRLEDKDYIKLMKQECLDRLTEFPRKPNQSVAAKDPGETYCEHYRTLFYQCKQLELLERIALALELNVPSVLESVGAALLNSK